MKTSVLKQHYTALFFLLIFMSCSSGFPPLPADSWTGSTTNNTSSSTTLDIYVIDVGQGDATIVLGPDVDGERTSLLVDAGPLDPDAGAIILDLFHQLGLSKLDYLMLTHFDADHMGGLVTVYDSTSILWTDDCSPKEFFPTQAIIDLGETDKETESVDEYLECRNANASNLDLGHFVVGQTDDTNIGLQINLGKSFTATVVAGNGYVLGNGTQLENIDTENKRSLAVLVSGPNDFNFLVMGDLPGITENNEDTNLELALGQALQSLNVNVSILRAGHHGSVESSSAEFLSLIQPEVSIISVGSNSYGHPTCTALENLFLYTDEVFQTEAGSPTSVCAEQENTKVTDGTIWIHVEDDDFAIEI